MVESVSTVDGSNVSGVIEEVGADGALCSDGHLRHSDRDVRIGTKKKYATVFGDGTTLAKPRTCAQISQLFR